MSENFSEEELRSIVARAANVAPDDVTVKTRDGSQIKANALWEGSCSPSSPKTRVGVFCASTKEELAIEGAVRRLKMGVSFPEAIIVLFDASGKDRRARVFGYPDSRIAAELSRYFGVAVEHVPRPTAVTDARPARTIDATEVVNALKLNPNIILQGPPGTGKTSVAIEAIRSIIAENGASVEECRFTHLVQSHGGDSEALIEAIQKKPDVPPVIWEMVQLHPGYAYEDLVQRLSPRTAGNGLEFCPQDMLLVQLCRIAALREATHGPVVLILDEINRANLGAVLGEFVFALDADHRGERVTLPHQTAGGSPSVYAPSNFWIVGTMNTADRSLALVDYALRRRFHFIDVLADRDVVQEWYATHPECGEVASLVFDQCNAGLPERLMIGHGAFLVDPIPLENWAERFARGIAFNVAPVLLEYAREGLRPSTILDLGSEGVPLDDPGQLVAKLVASIRSAS
jgi:MoxR-like ATPase